MAPEGSRSAETRGLIAKALRWVLSPWRSHSREQEEQQIEISPRSPPRVVALAKFCTESDNVPATIEQVMGEQSLSGNEKLLLYLELADHYLVAEDRLTAIHFLQTAREFLLEADSVSKVLLIRRFIAVGKGDLAAEIAVTLLLVENTTLPLLSQERMALLGAYKRSQQAAQSKAEHGHNLLLGWLGSHQDELKERVGKGKPVLVEVGTTRENVPEQGSTEKLATFCQDNALHFITVDMDPHNTQAAAALFQKMGVSFDAVCMKGENYLRGYEGQLDFVFLDAYDFEHGNHSELRQSRYEQFLGSRISDEQCHLMHLECVHSVVEKLAPNGVVCMDDTWLQDGNWTAKGTLAMPYLLEHGFRLLDVRNRAALLGRA